MNPEHKSAKTPSLMNPPRALIAGIFLLLDSPLHAGDSAFFQQTLALINQQRAKAEVQVVTLDDQLMKISGTWAERKAQADDLIHRKDFTSLLKELNYSYMNENIYYAKKPANTAPTAEQTVTGWMNSPGHRKNLLKDRIDRIGIGIARTKDGGYYIVCNGADSRQPEADPAQTLKKNGHPLMEKKQ
jgi:uncharacterized protein YkwD